MYQDGRRFMGAETCVYTPEQCGRCHKLESKSRWSRLMSFASAYAKTTPVAPARTVDYDASLMAVSLVATIGMLVSTFVTIVNPQWFVG
jgi:hypothetical protein